MYAVREREMRQAEYLKTFWVVTPPADTPFEAMLQPEYWAHVAGKVPALSEIYVHPEDNRFYARLLVMSAGRQALQVYPLEYIELANEPALEDDDPVFYKWGGPVAKFRVIRKSDGAVLAEGAEVATREMAEDFIRSYLKALAA